jgi:hypothetical protein
LLHEGMPAEDQLQTCPDATNSNAAARPYLNPTMA